MIKFFKQIFYQNEHHQNVVEEYKKIQIYKNDKIYGTMVVGLIFELLLLDDFKRANKMINEIDLPSLRQHLTTTNANLYVVSVVVFNYLRKQKNFEKNFVIQSILGDLQLNGLICPIDGNLHFKAFVEAFVELKDFLKIDKTVLMIPKS